MLAANQAYLISIGVPTEKQQKCLEAMEKYRDNQWWLSNDPKIRGYWQTIENFSSTGILLMPFEQYHHSIEALLNRGVFSHEMASPKLLQEAERAWKYGVGATSDKERVERFEESLQDLRDRGVDVNITTFPQDFD